MLSTTSKWRHLLSPVECCSSFELAYSNDLHKCVFVVSVYEFIVSSSAIARRPGSNLRQTRHIPSKQHMESIFTSLPEKINVSFWDYFRKLGNGDWTQRPMDIIRKFDQEVIRLSNSAGKGKIQQYLNPSIYKNLTYQRKDKPVVDSMSVLLNVLLHELHRPGSISHNSVPPSDTTNRKLPNDSCERTKRESHLFLSNNTSLEKDAYQNASLHEKQNVSGLTDDNERITILPLTESVQANESSSKPTRDVTSSRVKIVRKSRRRAYRSRVITPKRKKKLECQTIVACIHPYISYLAGTIMFILVVYLIIVFGKCVCDDSF
ncbi:uncharacterized protein LOC132562328 [Ylistrum balloti]|uniref:uncharacterized protein LOC132562328 n=1 Tax=Ylistrum balloti TaxID=509963 RepID=UPI002905868C|nr:uncharacterized protein LOC132562328 [Ylistrum balloti]